MDSSIDNHFWWCCESSKGNLEELSGKWLSILFHICNIHEFPENKIFKRCKHGDIERQWLSPDSSSFLALKEIITEKQFLSDLKYFTDFLHTCNLEVFHALLLKYVPKRLHFSMWGMISRTQLAVLPFVYVNTVTPSITTPVFCLCKYSNTFYNHPGLLFM